MRLLIIEDNKDLVKSMRLGLSDFQMMRVMMDLKVRSWQSQMSMMRLCLI